jgi:hypothetical protein
MEPLIQAQLLTQTITSRSNLILCSPQLSYMRGAYAVGVLSYLSFNTGRNDFVHLNHVVLLIYYA